MLSTRITRLLFLMKESKYLIRLVAASIIFIVQLSNIKSAYSHAPHDNISSLEISPEYINDKTLFILVRGQLLISRNGGKKWKRIINGLTSKDKLSSLEIDSNNKNIVFVASKNNDLYKSTNSGFSWLKSSIGFSDANINSIHITKFSSNIIFAVDSKKGIYRSSDGGNNWDVIPSLHAKVNALNSTLKNEHVIAGDDTGILYVSQDSGKTWLKKFNFPNSCSIIDIEISPEFITDRTFFVATNICGLYKTTNAGKTFIKVNNDFEDILPTSLAISPNFASDSKLFVSTWHKGIFRSTDKGLTWRKISSGLSKNKQADQSKLPHFRRILISNSFANDKTLFLAGFDGLFKSEDSGNSWLQIETLSSAIIVGLALSPNFRKDSTLAVTTYLKGAYISHDRGLSWKSMNTGLINGGKYVQPENHIARLFDIKFSPYYYTDKRIFSNSWKKFLISKNKGKSWNKISVDLKKIGATISISPDFNADDTIYLGTKKGNVLKSTDKGKNFLPLVNVEGQILSIVISPNFSYNKTIYISTKNKIYKFYENGNKLTSIFQGSNLSNLAISTSFSYDNSIFIGTSHGLYRSLDEGENWIRLPNELASCSIASIAISPNYEVDNELIVSVQGKGLYKSSNKGLTFIRISNELVSKNHLFTNFSYTSSQTDVPIEYSPSYIEDQTIYGFSDTKLFMSSDRGKTWKIIFSPENTKGKRNILYLMYYRLLYTNKIKFFFITIFILISVIPLVWMLHRKRNPGY